MRSMLICSSQGEEPERRIVKDSYRHVLIDNCQDLERPETGHILSWDGTG